MRLPSLCSPLLWCFAAAPAAAQTVVDWTVRQDSGLAQSDYAMSLAVADDGTVYAGGRSYNPTSGNPPPPPTMDAMALKCGADGTVQWLRRWNGPLSGDDRVDRALLDAGGTLWCAGYSAGYSGTNYVTQALLLRYDAAGNLLAARTFGDPAGPNMARSIVRDGAGIVYGCGHDGANGGDAAVWRFAADGSVLWTARIPEVFPGAYDSAYELAAGPSGEVYTCGTLGTVPAGTGSASVAFMSRLQPDGTVVWTRTWSGSAVNANTLYSLAANGQGGVCAVGALYNNGTLQDGVALLLDAAGTQLARSDFVGALSSADYARGVAADAHGRFFVGADGIFGATGRDCALELLDAGGALWRTIVDGGGAGDDSLRRVCVLPGGDLVAASTGPATSGPTSTYDAVLHGLDATGAPRWTRAISSSSAEQVWALVPGAGNEAHVGGWIDTPGVNNSNDMWIVRVGRTARAYCSGDSAPCPCGNTSAAGLQAGCANSLGSAARLVDAGASSLAADTLRLSASGMPNSSTLYFQGTGATTGTAFGDGVRCATGAVVRIATRTNVGGASLYPAAGEQGVAARGLVAAPGLRSYQVWYRNSAAFCSASTFNLSNGLLVEWTP